MAPAAVVDVNGLPLAAIEPEGEGLRLGALARNSDVAYHPLVTARYPALSQALLAGASPQIRNMASVGGNLLQRTRCPYFRDPASPCNKREPGSGCPAWDGYNRSNAVLGGSERCIATHPSDMCVALVALDAVVHARGPRGARAIPVADLHVLPAPRPEVETVLEPGELITHVTLPATPFAARSTYEKIRDRASFAFALASAAVALELRGGVVRAARVALGGVATKPWRSPAAEAVLVGQAPSTALFRKAAEAALAGAAPRPHNAFKVELAKRTLVRALERVGGAA
jgi:xanthine dehydrogenase YagS FAD-binding subunit